MNRLGFTWLPLLLVACHGASPAVSGDGGSASDAAMNGGPLDGGAADDLQGGSTVADTILEALRNQRDEGFNASLPAPGGLYINWIFTATPPPTMVNIQTSGMPDPSPATRHDRLTDVVYLADLALYSKLHPADPEFSAELGRYTQIVIGEFQGHNDERGWIYYLFKETAAILPAFNGYAESMADTFYNEYKANSTKYNNQTIPLHIDFPTADPLGTYRCDIALENGAVLVEDGVARGKPEYVAAGAALIAFVQSHCYNSQYKIWAMQMGHLFTDMTLTQVTPGNMAVIRQDPALHINGGDMKTGAIAELTEALCRAELATPGMGYGAIAQATLDDMVPGGPNQLGLWDPVNGGWFQGVVINGTSVQMPTSVTPSTSYKEVGRQATMLRALQACDRALGGRYRAAIDPVTQTVLRSYYKDGHGWVYQAKPDFSLYSSGGVVDNWVTSEAIGHSVRALLGLAALP